MELTQCASYYAIVSRCAENSGQPQFAEKASEAFKRLMPLIYTSGKTAGLNNGALLGRLQMWLDKMKSETDNSCVNLAALYKYAFPCKSLVESPDKRLRELLGKQ